jgi:hypothetical protein
MKFRALEDLFRLRNAIDEGLRLQPIMIPQARQVS